jgi:hypothetical protein
MQTLSVVELGEGWRVEQDGEVIFTSPFEEPCFVYALDTSSQLFEDGVEVEVVLRRLG